jgi:hypothetical protein
VDLTPAMVVVPAGNGWRWVRRGFVLFARAPVSWILIATTYWVLMTLVGLVPYAGLAAALLVTPAFSVSFMAMCRELEQGRSLELKLLFAGFRRNARTLVLLGGIYLALLVGILAATRLVDGGALMRWMLAGRGPARGSPEAAALGDAAIVGSVLFVPVILAFWFAPVLVAWHRMPAAKALFFSFFASLRNWPAFLVYAVALAVVAGLVPGVAFSLLVVGMQGAKGGGATIQLFALAIVVTLLPAIYASIYASYRDIFPDRPPERAAETPAEA